uniref:Nuclear pore complex protein Nup85 n=1 Tax=Steinernema glaseri TaxID=37863 RepID=A0A1I7Z2X9_9BILA
MDTHDVTADQPQGKEVMQCKTEEGRRILQLAAKKGVVRSADQRKKHAKLLLNPAYLKLVNESYDVFTRLHEATKVAPSEPSEHAKYLKSLDQASREYRAVLRSAIVTIRPSSSERDRELLLCLRGREMLWGLIELVAFCDQEEEIGCHLSKWARMMLSSAASDLYGQVITSDASSRSSERNDLYWNGVILQVLSCNFASAATMLQSHTEAAADKAVGKMLIIMERLDRLFAEGYNSEQFVKIQETLRTLLNTQYFVENRSVEFIARLLSGETQAFADVCSGLVDYWCEVIPLFTITQVPNATLTELNTCADTCFGFNKDEKNHQFDVTLSMALDGRIPEALAAAASCFGDWWFSAHLGDLIFRIKPTILFEDDANLRDVFLLEYSYVLFGDDELWRSGVEYLTAVCSGFDLLEEFIVQDPIKTTEKGARLLEICEKWNLQEGRRSVTRKLTEICLSEDELANALVWASKNGDSSLISEVVGKIIKKAPEELIGIVFDIKYRQESALSLPELAFLKEYYAYLVLAQERKTNEVLARLTTIFKDKLAPTFMYAQLLEGLINVVEERDAKLSDFVQPILESVQHIKIEIKRSHHTLERCNEVEEKLKVLTCLLTGHLLCKNLVNKKP